MKSAVWYHNMHSGTEMIDFSEAKLVVELQSARQADNLGSGPNWTLNPTHPSHC